MSDTAAARRMQLIERLIEAPTDYELGDLARMFDVDERTVRRDVDHLHEIVSVVGGIELRRSHVRATMSGSSAGYFSDQLSLHRQEKERIAQAVVASLPGNVGVTITAGSTTFYVAKTLRRAALEGLPPHNLIVHTNSLPALQELIAAGISTGVVGEVYSPDDCAFHSQVVASDFQASIVVVGASGVVADAEAGALRLFSHRAEEAAFLKQLLAPAPEIIVAADVLKLGRRHPWPFTSPELLAGKRVTLVTGVLDHQSRFELQRLADTAGEHGTRFTFTEVGVIDP